MMDTLRTGESRQVEEGMVRSADDVHSEKEVDKKGKRLSRKKSKGRGRKKRSHSKGVSDGEVEPAETDDMKESSAGRLSRHHSIPSREQKTRSLSGSRKRLSGWFKRKSRSESRGRSKSETELSKVERNAKTKRHESAEDVKRGSKAYDSSRDSTYEVYDITKQPRDRLKRMTVRDAVKERRLRKATSGHTLSRLDRYIDTEEGEKARTSSLPDISVVDPQGDTTNEYRPDESRDAIDSASTLVRGSVTLPRESNNRLGKKQKPSKAGRVSIEADSDDNIISPTIPQSSSRLQDNDHNKSERTRQESPQTQIEVMVHDIASLVEQDKPTSEQNAPGDDTCGKSENSGEHCNSKDSSRASADRVSEQRETKDNDSPVSMGEGQCGRGRQRVPTVCVSRVPPSKAVKRWQTAIIDVQQKRRKQSLSHFLKLSRSPNPHSLVGGSVSRDLSPGDRKLSSSRSPSPRSKCECPPKEKIQEILDKPPPSADTNSEVQPSQGQAKTDDTQPDRVKNTLAVHHHIDRSLSDGEGRTVLEKKDQSPQKYQRSVSAVSEPTKGTEGPSNGDRNGVPVMGTSVQQKYKRTFSPKRQEAPVVTDKEESKSDKSKNDESNEEGKTKETDLKEKAAQDNSQDKVATESEEGKVKKESEEANVKRDASKHASETEKSIDNSDMSKALENRGRDSQRRRIKSGRSFRRKKEIEEEAIKAEKAQQQEAEVAKEEEMSPIRLMYDKSTQTSEIDLYEKSKSNGKSKKNKKTKKEKEKEKKKMKEVTSLVHEPNKEEEKKIHKAEESVDNKTVDTEKTKDLQDEKQDTSKVSPDSEKVAVLNEKNENDKNTAEDDSKPKPKKLSFATMVFLKQRMASRRKKKALDEKAKKDKDSGKDMFLIENEINLSKLADIKETDILDDEFIEPGIGLDLPRKQIRFEPVTSDEPIQSEEPLPPLARNRVKSMSGRRESTMREKRKKCLQCCKKFTAFLFSHIGLCSLVVAYTIMGGFIFKAIEGPFEDKVKTIIRDTRTKMVDKMLQHATELSLSEIGHDNFTAIVDEHLKAFQKTVFKETKEHGWDGKDKSDSDIPEMQWSFASSLLYAITVMTTIGYGHVAPKTDQGRIVTIGYAVLGIPLTLLCLTNIGDVMATGFRLLYGKVCCGLCCKLFRPRRRRIPDLEKGLAHQVMASEEEEADKPREVIHVPTSLCILLIAGYIFAGALLFALWEKWDYLTGSYFCFITLSTIGFGDIVPGTDLNAWSQEEKLVLCAMYLVFGLSLIAMCFNLVQEDVKAKCRWLGMKLGIIDKPESSV